MVFDRANSLLLSLLINQLRKKKIAGFKFPGFFFKKYNVAENQALIRLTS